MENRDGEQHNKKKNQNRKLGHIQEKIAIDFLIKNGYNIKISNYARQCGEIDIIAQKDDYIHFIEVKYRKNTNYGYPREAVTKSKQTKIKKTSLYYIQELGEEIDIKEIGYSFDVIEIIDKEINYIPNAFY
ncbi:MAG: YraN family protein [bacterium]